MNTGFLTGSRVFRGSGSPVSCRRTFAAAIHGLRSLGGDWRFAFQAALVSHAGSMTRATLSWSQHLGLGRFDKMKVARHKEHFA
jgi:hypothetical protein